jgi:ubiquinone/menaquinone biosynthesis C-methylase UbiE
MIIKSVLFVVASIASAQVEHQHHPPRDAAEYAKVLENPARDAWQKPHEVIAALKIRPDEVIADIGAGSGYFTRRLAKHAGKVYAVDIDAKLLERVASAGAKNVITVHATPDDPKLPEGAVDTIFICNVLHHIENRPAYYAKLLKALKPDGRIVNIDFHKRPLPVGPPVSMKLSEEEVAAEMKSAGLRAAEKHEFLQHQYFLIFRR